VVIDRGHNHAKAPGTAKPWFDPEEKGSGGSFPNVEEFAAAIVQAGISDRYRSGETNNLEPRSVVEPPRRIPKKS
jgi:hypothetical protein